MNADVGAKRVGAAEWQDFLNSPSAYAGPQWLLDRVDRAIGEEACQRMITQPRLERRLSDILIDFYKLPQVGYEAKLEDTDRDIAVADGERLDEVAARAGAIYWATSVANTIRGANASALRAALGSELCALAVANRDLAGPAQPLEPLDDLRDRIEADGWRCIEAWRQALPPGIGIRVQMKHQAEGVPEPAPSGPIGELGPAIVRRAAAREAS